MSAILFMPRYVWSCVNVFRKLYLKGYANSYEEDKRVVFVSIYIDADVLVRILKFTGLSDGKGIGPWWANYCYLNK